MSMRSVSYVDGGKVRCHFDLIGLKPDRYFGEAQPSNALRLRRSHSHHIPATSLGFIEALVRYFE